MSDPRLALSPRILNAAGAPVLEALDRLRPVIRVGSGLHPAAATAIGGLYSLLVRVHPHAVIDGDAPMGPNPWGAESLLELPCRIAPSRVEPAVPGGQDLVIGAGPSVSGADIWIGGNDWTARQGDSPQPLDVAEHGLGVHAAAALVASEVMKIALGKLAMMHVRTGGTLVWNLIDYCLTPAPNLAGMDVRGLTVALLGAGSVGSSSAGLVVCDPATCGFAWIIDPDSYDPSRNPYRYAASTGRESGPKADWLADLLRHHGWQAEGHVGAVADWVRNQPDPGFDGIVVSSVDRVDSRLDVADVLARTTLSVGIDGLALHIQREHPLDEWACPYCDFVSLAPPMTKLQALANMVGLPVVRVAELELEGAVLDADDLAAVAAQGKVHAERAQSLVGRRLDDLRNRVYAEATVPVGGTAPTTVSAPYVSWMAGVLVASELAKAARGLELVDRRVDLDMSGVPLGAVRRRARDSSGHCVCWSPWRRRWATKMYPRITTGVASSS